MLKPTVNTTRQNAPLSELQFCAWVAQAVPGDRLEYHRGHLAVDADKVTSDLDPNARAELALLRDRAFWSEGQGLVHLVQQRLGPDHFAYLAIARPKPASAADVVTQIEAIAA
jgi:hypothetical protein